MVWASGAVGAAWSAARGWLTPSVLFVAVNLVIATIAVASRLMSPGEEPAGGGERRVRGLLRAPSLAADRLLSSFSFSRLGLAGDHAQPPGFDAGAPEKEEEEECAGPDIVDQQAERREEARIERSRSEAPAPGKMRRRPRAREEPAVVEVDARADDFIRRFREQLRLQRLDSILRYRDTLRRTGTA